jgi:acyl-CoA reductase-like NAD-dependent aldehyde dehydrogenase
MLSRESDVQATSRARQTNAVPALMAGNAAVLKPDVQTSFTALWAVDLLRQAGLPPDVFGVVTGEGPLLGPALGDRVDFVMFTGSTRTGRLVARQAAERLIPCSLELGGKNPAIVLADADLDAAVYGAIQGCFASAGQVCVSIERIYVHESIAERFLGRLVERTCAPNCMRKPARMPPRMGAAQRAPSLKGYATPARVESGRVAATPRHAALLRC